jgi:hypothetical protein
MTSQFQITDLSALSIGEQTDNDYLRSYLAPLSCNTHILLIRVARWYIFKPKIPILVNFGVLQRKMVNFRAIWSISLPFETFYGHLVNFGALLKYIFHFGKLYLENLTTLSSTFDNYT